MVWSETSVAGAVVWRGVNPSGAVFQWQSPQGESVLAYHLTDGYFQMMFHDVDLDDAAKQQAAKDLVQKIRAAAGDGPALMPVGGDHMGPLTAHGKTLLDQALPGIRPINIDGFMAALGTSGRVGPIVAALSAPLLFTVKVPWLVNVQTAPR